MNGPAPRMDLNWRPREREAQLLAELLRGSRLTVLFGAASSGKSMLLRAGVLPLLHRRASDRDVARGGLSQVVPFPDRRNQDSWERRAEVAVLFDAWGDAPLASLHARLAAALPVTGLAMEPPFDSLRANLSAWNQELGVSFLIVLDRFERCLTASADEAGIAEFVEELVQAVNEPSLQANFLVSVRDDAEPLLERLRERIPAVGDACLRLPAPHAVTRVAAAAPAAQPIQISERMGPDAGAPPNATALPGLHPPALGLQASQPSLRDTTSKAPTRIVTLGLRPAGLRPAERRPGRADAQAGEPHPPAAPAASARQLVDGQRRARAWLAASLSCAALLVLGALLLAPRLDTIPSGSTAAVALDTPPAAGAGSIEPSYAAVARGAPESAAASPAVAVPAGAGDAAAAPAGATTLAVSASTAVPLDAAPAGAALLASPASAAKPDAPSVELVIDAHDSTDDRIARDLARTISPDAGYALAVRSDVSAEPAAPAAPVLAVVRHDALQAASQALTTARKAVDGLRIVMPLYTEEIYFIARRDSPLAFIHQVHGSRINFGSPQGRRKITTTMVYERMFGAPAATANASFLEDEQALDRLVGDKSLDAMIVVAAQPSKWLSQLPPQTARSIKLLRLDPGHATSQRAVESYLPTMVRATNHRAWLSEDIPTLAAMTFLVHFNHADPAAAERLGAFAQALCRNLPLLRRDGHPKWREVQTDLQLEVGWAYSAPAQAALRSCLTRPVAADRAAVKSQSHPKGTEQ